MKFYVDSFLFDSQIYTLDLLLPYWIDFGINA